MAQVLKDPALKAVLRTIPVLLAPALLGFLFSVPATVHAHDRAGSARQWNGRDDSDEFEVPPSQRRLDPLRFPGRPVDLGWIDRLNAYSADGRAHPPGVLPVLPRLGLAPAATPGWPRVPAEFEPQEALLLPVGLLADEAPEILTDLVAGTRHRLAIVGLVADAAQRLRVEQTLRKAGLSATHLQFTELAHNTKWVRDYGPIFVWMQNQRRAAVDTEYPESGRDADDAMPGKLAGRFHARLLPAPIVFEGGNLLSNGQGLCLTTTAVVVRNSDRQDAESRVCQVFRECFGSVQTVFLEPLMGEKTGHVDMYACFTAPDVVVLGACDPAQDMQNAALLDRNAARLAGLSTPWGPLRVVRIPMPPHQDGFWRTYTNVIFANGAVLMPTYLGVDQQGRERALEIFARLMPGWKVIGVDCTRLIQGGGALRCVSATVPLSTHRPLPPASRATPQRTSDNSRIDSRGRRLPIW